MSTVAVDEPLLAMSDDEFRHLVAEALKVGNVDYRGPITPETVDKLKSPELVDRTHLVLVGMKKNVEGQLAAKKADYIKERSRHSDPHEIRKVEREYQTWRAGALRFKSGVEEFMVSIRGKRDRPDDGWYLAYETLRAAILHHRATVLAALENDEDPPEHTDEILWSMVDATPDD